MKERLDEPGPAGGVRMVSPPNAVVQRPALPPLFRWPGGKRWLVPRLLDLAVGHDGQYFEPFFGAGALFFALSPSRARISDRNADLMAFYRAIRDSPDKVSAAVGGLPRNREAYYDIRRQTPSDEIARAARFIYLTSLGFNGIHRVNLRGEFNVPYSGRVNIPIDATGSLQPYSVALQSAEIVTADFEDGLIGAGAGSFVYLDPPYTVAHANNGFVKYNDRIFLWDDQRRLASVAAELDRAGAIVVVSNACHDSILKLYPAFEASIITRPSVMAAGATHRRPVTEYLLTNVG